MEKKSRRNCFGGFDAQFLRFGEKISEKTSFSVKTSSMPYSKRTHQSLYLQIMLTGHKGVTNKGCRTRYLKSRGLYSSLDKRPWTAAPVPIKIKMMKNSICTEIPSKSIPSCSVTVNSPIKVNLRLGPARRL